MEQHIQWPAFSKVALICCIAPVHWCIRDSHHHNSASFADFLDGHYANDVQQQFVFSQALRSVKDLSEEWQEKLTSDGIVFPASPDRGLAASSPNFGQRLVCPSRGCTVPWRSRKSVTASSPSILAPLALLPLRRPRQAYLPLWRSCLGRCGVSPSILGANVFGSGNSERKARTRGAKAPNLIGFKAPATKLLDVLSARGAPAKSRARQPSTASMAGGGGAAASGVPKESASMQAELLGAIAAIGE
eukprot:6470346-Amphidinium_carterae.1